MQGSREKNARCQEKNLGCRPLPVIAVVLQQSSEPAGGQVVLHLHMHVFPVRMGVERLPAQTFKEDASVLQIMPRK